MIAAGQIVWVYDGVIRPPGNKMYVCLCPQNGLYFRINSLGHWPGSVPISQSDHPFLDHDSFIECNGPLEVDDYSIEESLRVDGVLGELRPTLKTLIIEVVSASPLLPENYKTLIITGLS